MRLALSWSCLICCAVVSIHSVSGRDHKLAVYWGQNAVYNKRYPPKNYEDSVDYFCLKSKYDRIILSFLNIFFDPDNLDDLPGLNFAFHCKNGTNQSLPFLFHCPKMEQGIKDCQSNGKKVLISLGGAAGLYGFTSDTQATKFAQTLWDLFLGGNDPTGLRPFGSAILDGINLDIEGGQSTGYTTFVKQIRSLMDASGRDYIISAAPQCVYPDAYLGPGEGTALTDAADAFDEVYVQFYNNYCSTGYSSAFWASYKQWISYANATSPNGPRIYIGMPSSKGGASRSDNDYRTPDQVYSMYKKVKDESAFGGFMLWDASFDQNNIIDGHVYTVYLSEILDGTYLRRMKSVKQRID